MSFRKLLGPTVMGAVVLLTGCAESATEPAGPEVELSAVKFWDAGATANWNQRATALAATRASSVVRVYTYLSMAQFRAAEAAEAIRPHPPTTAAIGAASATVLSAFFPLDVAAIEAALDAQEAAAPWPGAKHENFAVGEALGRAIGAKVLAYAAGDRLGLTSPGAPPVGAGYWTGAAPARGGYRARPIILTTGDEFLPGPPPAFGSPGFQAALAEVRQISDTRTPLQLAIAQYWNTNQSPSSGAAMNNLAVELIRSHRRSDAEAARILFVASAAWFDATIGCFNAKYTYWFLRPSQADPLTSLPIGLPPHPSYPSAHSCVSGAVTGVLVAEFPSEATRLAAIAEEASLSRLYAGIHYRFDMEAGLALGRGVAAAARAADLSTVAILP